MISPGERRFLVSNRLAIISLFLVILAGGIVRSSGSGMGCPDWPKCFDRYVPPVSKEQLPADYREKYVAKRVVKNERFAKTLDLMGYGDLALRLRNDPSIREPEVFNAAKTWTEYINRLVGVVTGFFLIACAVYSFSYRKSAKRITCLSVLNVLLVGFQGWLGSIVVSTNLLAWVVTVHMLLAMAIVAVSIYTFFYAKKLRTSVTTGNRTITFLKVTGFAAMTLTLFQIVTGTEVREQVDAVSRVMNSLNRDRWVAEVGIQFDFHRDMSLVVALVSVLFSFLVLRRFKTGSTQRTVAMSAIAVLFLQMIAGICLAYFALPGVAQASHVTLAALLFGAQFYLLLLLGPGSAEGAKPGVAS